MILPMTSPGEITIQSYSFRSLTPRGKIPYNVKEAMKLAKTRYLLKKDGLNLPGM